MLAGIAAATLSGCGHATRAAPPTPAASTTAALFGPYSISCIAQSFASSGTRLMSIFGVKTAAGVGYQELAPNHPGIGISISALADSAHAVADAVGIRIMDRQLHRSSLLLQDHNLVVEYRNAPGERERVGRAVRLVRKVCAAGPNLDVKTTVTPEPSASSSATATATAWDFSVTIAGGWYREITFELPPGIAIRYTLRQATNGLQCGEPHSYGFSCSVTGPEPHASGMFTFAVQLTKPIPQGAKTAETIFGTGHQQGNDTLTWPGSS